MENKRETFWLGVCKLCKQIIKASRDTGEKLNVFASTADIKFIQENTSYFISVLEIFSFAPLGDFCKHCNSEMLIVVRTAKFHWLLHFIS